MPDGRVRDDGPVRGTTAGGIRIEDPGTEGARIEMAFEAGVDPAHRLFFACPECGFTVPRRTPPGRRLVRPECGTTFDRE